MPDLATVERLLRATHAAGQGSFLTVLKRFGEGASPGLLSFPCEGWTLTLDVPDRGAATEALIATLDDITLEAGGRVNPYKARAMTARTFHASFPRWDELESFRDPQFQSGLWRRVTSRAQVDAPAMTVNHLPEPDLEEMRASSAPLAHAKETTP